MIEVPKGVRKTSDGTFFIPTGGGKRFRQLAATMNMIDELIEVAPNRWIPMPEYIPEASDDILQKSPDNLEVHHVPSDEKPEVDSPDTIDSPSDTVQPQHETPHDHLDIEQQRTYL